MSDTVQFQKTSEHCRVLSCTRLIWARHYCNPHYQKFRKYGYVPNTPIAKFAAVGSNPTCSLDSCERKHHAKGLCHTHYCQTIRRLKEGEVGTNV
jgi:hypothetical protein